MEFLFIPSFLAEDYGRLQDLSFILTIFYGAVLAGIGLDLVGGVERARREGTPRRSHAFKRTVYKVKDYFNVLLLLTVVDVVASIWFSLPFFTAVGVIGLLYVEGKSIYENKKGISKGVRDLPSAIREIMDNRDKLEELIKILDKNSNIKKNEKDNT